MIDIVIPTFRRVVNIQKMYDNLKDLKDTRMVFVAHESDFDSQEAINKLGCKLVIDTQSPSGVNATNAGYWGSETEWVVIGQDDINFHLGWLDNALKYITKDIKVVGLNDGFYPHERVEHSVCWLVNKPYIEKESLSIGHKNVIFNPDYHKNYADDELNATAKFRKVWAYASDSWAEHIHPGFQKAEMDDTYRMHEDKCSQDHELFVSRQHLWSSY